MKINGFEDVKGLMPTEDIVEGRFVLLTPHSFSQDFGSETDLPGAKLPDTADEAKRAVYCLTWKVDNRQVPIMQPIPSFQFAERGGWSRPANAPFTTTVYLTHPGNQEGLTIPSGMSALGYREGEFTLSSGAYVDTAGIRVVGAAIVIANTADDGAGDAGKPKVAASASGWVGETYRFDSNTLELTIKTF